jgi:hypothetical protein
LNSLLPFQYLCFVAPFVHNDVQNGWWTGSNGTTSYYWDGEHGPDSHVCACDADGTCVEDEFACNCDAGAAQWFEDSGRLTSAGALPVVELRFGGLKFDGQAAQFQLGPLVCSGRKVINLFFFCSSYLEPLSGRHLQQSANSHEQQII